MSGGAASGRTSESTSTRAETGPAEKHEESYLDSKIVVSVDLTSGRKEDTHKRTKRDEKEGGRGGWVYEVSSCRLALPRNSAARAHHRPTHPNDHHRQLGYVYRLQRLLYLSALSLSLAADFWPGDPQTRSSDGSTDKARAQHFFPPSARPPPRRPSSRLRSAPSKLKSQVVASLSDIEPDPSTPVSALCELPPVRPWPARRLRPLSQPTRQRQRTPSRACPPSRPSTPTHPIQPTARS